eukprot:EC123773.1.p1 GENE.EC123773.1~~EC123773.1.p1  ORF type:complete len:111 (+),score=5.34 EC123773.1:168-500(+)
MKLKQLESILGDVSPFEKPNVRLEQYATSPHIAARLLYTMHTVYDDIEGKCVADFGCGGGVFCVGSEVLGSGCRLSSSGRCCEISSARTGADNRYRHHESAVWYEEQQRH